MHIDKPLSSPASLEQVSQWRDEQLDALLDLISQILDELELRLLEFCELVGEKIFKAHPDISSQFDPAQVQQFKRELNRAAEEGMATLVGTLADEDYWLNETVSKKGYTSLRHNLKVWEEIQTFSQVLVPVLKSYGYPYRNSVILSPYKELEIKELDQLPKSEQLRMLVLKYWAALVKYQQLQQDVQKVQTVVNHQTLEDLWRS